MTTTPNGREDAAALDLLRAELRRTNFAGRPVTLGEGILAAAACAILAGQSRSRLDGPVIAAIGLLGLADDLLEPRQRAAGSAPAKGLRGHLGALRRGRLTTGAAKAIGIPALALVAAAGAPGRGGPTGILVDAALCAGAANLANLLDLRPGRALKALIPAATAIRLLPISARDDDRAASARALALAAALPGIAALPADLREHGMLGDCGANALGSAAGIALARSAPLPVRVLVLAGVTGLTLASERISFSRVIDSTPLLRAVDSWGRRRGDA